MSDVVATILILALTVTLFASIFGFVTSFPSPPAQNTNQFQAALVRTANQTYISGVTITHLAGPVISTSDKVYLQTASLSTNWQFSIAGGIPISWGLSPPNSSTGWNLGQVWSTSFPKLIKVPDNITVFIVTPKQLLFTVLLPGLTIAAPPTVASAGITPASPGIGAAFQIFASLSGNLTGATVTVALSGIPGLSGTPAMVQYNSLWVYNVSSGATNTNGTFYAYITVVNGAGQTGGTAVVVPIASSGGGGGSTPTLSVSVGMNPQPPTLPQTSSYFWATVSYTGTQANQAVTVTFYVNETPGSPFAARAASCTFAGQSGLTITGPSTLTIYSALQPTFPSSGGAASCSKAGAWFLGSTGVVAGTQSTTGMSIQVQALASVGTIGKAVGAIKFSTATNLLTGYAFVNTANPPSGGNTTTFSHTCTTTTCPYMWVRVVNNYNTTLGAPAANWYFNGTIYYNATGHTNSKTFTSATTTQTAAGTTTNIDPLGTGTRWTGTVAGTWTLTVFITVQVTFAWGTYPVGFIYGTTTITVT